MTRFIAYVTVAIGAGAAACVSLDKPAAVEACLKNNNCSDNSKGGAGGALVGDGGAAGTTTGTTPTGGAAGATTTSQGSGGTGPGQGGATSAGGRAAGGAPASGGAAGNVSTDAGPGSGGAVHGGGTTGVGGSTGAGGAAGDQNTDAALPDVPIGSGGRSATDVVTASGGLAATGGGSALGGATGNGGVTASGGTATSGGGKTGSGGTTASGGAVGTGGTTGYNCASAIEIANGLVTDFTNVNAATSTWTSGSLTGNFYRYGSTGATTTAKVEGTPAGVHITGSIPSGNYGGVGLTFYSCVTIASFTAVSFDVYGTAANCLIELQLQTYDQRPVEQSPPGGCKADGGSACFRFPVKSRVVSLASTVNPPGTTVSTTLSTMANWTSVAAGQIVGIQWQFTPSGGTCTPDATVTNVRWVR